METWQHAAILATISGLTLPFGAILGIILSPVRDVVSAAWVAFGAGALLFAVTVELYGHALRELEIGRTGIYEMVGTIGGAFIGALFYLAVNRWLEESFEDHTERTEDVERFEAESDGQSFVGSLGPTESTPFLAKRPSFPVNSALAEERQRWEQMVAHKEGREDSFSRNISFSRDYSFSRFGNRSFAYSEGSFKSRGRDYVLHKIGASRSVTSKSGPRSIADESLAEVDPEMVARGNSVAYALFLGLLVDGVPEGILMGFLAAEGHLSTVLIVSLLVANFPEAFSAASLMVQGGLPVYIIVSMWTSLCLMVGVLAGASCYLLQVHFPKYPAGDLPSSLLISAAVVQGLTGGAMISCIANVMLPEAFARGGGRHGPLIATSGFLCTAGFLVAVSMKAVEHHYHDIS
jgi:hypothetical protein